MPNKGAKGHKKSINVGASSRIDAAATTINEVTKMLAISDCFSGLSRPLLKEIASLSEIRMYPEGAEVFAVHDPGDFLYGVLSGSLLIYVRSPDGKEMSLSTTEPGEIGGEIGVIDGGNRTTNGRTLGQSILAIIPRKGFLRLLLKRPEISIHMLQYLCQRVRQASAQVEDVAFLSTEQRLAKRLRALVAAGGHEVPVKIRISQKDLASFANTARQNVNLILGQWQTEGLIRIQRSCIEILDLDGLNQKILSQA
ncbi:MAG: Crp/Fnr family transcriptional regulator [Pseudomonadota bacterium]